MLAEQRRRQPVFTVVPKRIGLATVDSFRLSVVLHFHRTPRARTCRSSILRTFLSVIPPPAPRESSCHSRVGGARRFLQRRVSSLRFSTACHWSQGASPPAPGTRPASQNLRYRCRCRRRRDPPSPVRPAGRARCSGRCRCSPAACRSKKLVFWYASSAIGNRAGKSGWSPPDPRVARAHHRSRWTLNPGDMSSTAASARIRPPGSPCLQAMPPMHGSLVVMPGRSR